MSSVRTGHATERITVTYDQSQRCVAKRHDLGRHVAMDCPETGGGLEFSADDLLGAALAGSMLLTMGALAKRELLDLSDATVDVEIAEGTERIKAIGLKFMLPGTLCETDRVKLEEQAELCPLKHSLHPDIRLFVSFKYPKPKSAARQELVET